MVAEGVKTAVTSHELAERYGVDMPVHEEIYRVVVGRGRRRPRLPRPARRPPGHERSRADARTERIERGPGRARGDPAAGAVARRADGRPRQPRATAGRDQGRRAPGVVGVDGRDHDGAVVRPPQRRRQGGGQAARLARLPRHQVPDRRARPLVPHPPARRSAGCSRTRAARRTPTSSTSPPAPSASASSPRCSPRRPAATSMPRHGAAAAGPVHRPRRRRRARRGQRVGGDRRPGAAGPRQRHARRRHQPPEPRPGRPRP